VRSGTAVATILFVIATAACGPASSIGAHTSLTVYAAASLKSVMAKVVDAYRAAIPGTVLTISTDSSAALETKIEQGASSDVFLSADTSNPQKLIDAGLASGDLVPFARNELAIIVPAGNPDRLVSPVDLAKSGVKVIAAEDSVPISRYAQQLIANLARLPGFPPQFAAAYAANVVSKEESVAGIVTKVELGEGDAGIVYVTDARASTRVRTIDIPASANVSATYGGVVLRASPNRATAEAFLSWLTGAEGRMVFEAAGFRQPG
jgi:molybdate transport system substrate-binding protein